VLEMMKARTAILGLLAGSVVVGTLVLHRHTSRVPGAADPAAQLQAHDSDPAALAPANLGEQTSAFPSAAEGTSPAAHSFAQPAVLPPELRSLAEQDSAAAAARINELPGALQPEFAAAIASAWAKTAPEQAAAWATELLNEDARVQAVLSLSAAWATTNPAAAAELGPGVLPEARQPEFLNAVALQWGRADAVAALSWAEHLPAQAARDSFLAGVICALAETSPAQAARFVPSLGPGRYLEETALTVILELGRKEPEAAAEWVQLFPAGHLREVAVRNMVSLWAEQAAVLGAAPSALQTWPEGPERDQAIRYYLDEVLETQPARAAEVLPALSDKALRQEETQRVAQHLPP
jgi:hypothetical protein